MPSGWLVEFRSSPTLASVARDFRARASRTTLGAFGIALVGGGVSYYLGTDAGLTIATGALVALIVALGLFVTTLVAGVLRLEQRAGRLDAEAAELALKIGIHAGIYGWVEFIDLDEERSKPLVEYDLELLAANVLNEIRRNERYPAALAEQIEKITSGHGAVAERYAELVRQLRSNLQAGSYIRS